MRVRELLFQRAIDIRAVCPPLFKLCLTKHHRFVRQRFTKCGHTFKHLHGGNSIQTLFQLRNDLRRQLLPHHHGHRVLQRRFRIVLDELLDHRPSGPRQLHALRHQLRTLGGFRFQVVLAPGVKCRHLPVSLNFCHDLFSHLHRLLRRRGHCHLRQPAARDCRCRPWPGGRRFDRSRLTRGLLPKTNIQRGDEKHRYGDP